MSDICLSSRVRLARNYEDFPFRRKMTPAQSEQCVQRTLEALRDLEQPYTYLPLRGMEENEKKLLLESHLISADLMEHEETGAALLRDDEKVSVLMNEEDHLRILGWEDGEALETAAEYAFSIDSAVQRQFRFAFDEQWGFLTASPTNAGTGLKASMILHLPMLTLFKQMGQVNQLAAKLRLTIRGMYGEGSEAQGHLYLLSSLGTLGRTEKETLGEVAATARQIAQMERQLREKAMEKDMTLFEDQVFRGYGLLSNARRMPLKEFMVHWSNLRLGAASGKLPVTTAVCDTMLMRAQPAHVCKAAGGTADPRAKDIARSDIIRKLLSGAA